MNDYSNIRQNVTGTDASRGDALTTDAGCRPTTPALTSTPVDETRVEVVELEVVGLPPVHDADDDDA